jgi:glutamate N-acetyltransferase / amino-acid N-acetyltransferase
MKDTEKGVCCKGFKAAGIKEGRNGLALISSEKEANCAVMITSNRVKAAPLIVSGRHAKKGKIKGIVISSGNANAYTGKQGIKDAEAMCTLASKELGLKKEDLLVASTGVIGRRLDMQVIERQIKEAARGLSSKKEGSRNAANAIMTTDTLPKSVSVKTQLKSGVEIEIGGIAKGAGMVAPDLRHATMLCFLTTDAYVPDDRIKKCLEIAVSTSFNNTIIDGDMSTNDIVVLMANGTAGNRDRDIDSTFQDALNHVTTKLAKMLAKNAEGATKFIEVEVKNAKTDTDAKKAARAVAGSSLVKSAIYGKDPNWGRIVAALGYSGADINPDGMSLFLQNTNDEVCLVEQGKVRAYQDSGELKAAEKILDADEITITIDLHMGTKNAQVFGCDLTPEYVRINSEYST